MKATSKLFPPIILLGLSIVINTLPAHALSCPSGGERLSVSGRGSSYFASYHGDNEGGKMESSKLIAVGDNNGDGIDDMAFLIDEGMGTIHIIYGSLGNMDTMMKPMYRYSSQDKGYTIVGTPDCIISSFGFVGDFNGDGIGGDAAIGCKGLRKVIVIYGIQTYERDRVYLDTTSLSSNLAFQVKYKLYIFICINDIIFILIFFYIHIDSFFFYIYIYIGGCYRRLRIES